MKDEIDRLKEEEKMNSEERAGWTAADEPSREKKYASDKLVFGVLLILLGFVFFFGRFSGLLLRNWWAWFLLVPALMKLVSALRLVDTRGRLTPAAASMFSGSFFLLLLGLIFLLGLSWTLFWPFVLIFIGLNGVMWAFVDQTA